MARYLEEAFGWPGDEPEAPSLRGAARRLAAAWAAALGWTKCKKE